ncbi:uncharacterized protein NEMAJ01_1749 [Nematocida major]|uniref:uncharacterized protein n=1 Tax=Nematocida major TaxID=1912982 RepID=UPI0020075971|nr:uncharacterized protein NEMAJ01_1749 [Nematocida major]KAH9386853.1 hypothetical protein NEMAJ01_1749 [Nematocida major]
MESHAQLSECFTKYIELKKKIDDRRRELHGLQQRRDALLDLLVYIKGQKPPKCSEFEGEDAFPMSLGKAHSKFSLTSVGILPPEECTSFYNSMYIYPIGYKSKRKYVLPGQEDQKAAYFCQIRSVNGECVFEIRTTGGKNWTGSKDEVWADFTREFKKMSFPDIEAFFGLSNETAQKIIEDMGEISVFSSYIPIHMRNRKTKRHKEAKD